MNARPNPYVVGQWVRGDRFYGREREIAAILGGDARCVWFVGLRRVGKTSLLKQVEHLVSGGGRLLPVFWDLQGAVDAEELELSLRDGLLDASGRLACRDIAVESLPLDPAGALGALASRLAALGEAPLLLCDEVEELLELAHRDGAAFGRLWEALLATPGLCIVLASSPRFEAVAAASSFASLPTPRYLGPLAGDDLTGLIMQRQLPEPSRPMIDDDAVSAIAVYGGGHPFLTQLLCRRVAESGDVERAFTQLAGERTVAHLVEVDLALLSPLEQRLLRLVATTDRTNAASLAAALPEYAGRLDSVLDRLSALGVVSRSGGTVHPGNPLLGECLARTSG